MRQRRYAFLSCPKDHVEHEVDKDAGIARLLGGMEHLVVAALVAQDHHQPQRSFARRKTRDLAHINHVLHPVFHVHMHIIPFSSTLE